MLFQMIKKEFLLIKKYLLPMVGLSVLIPLFMLWQVPEYAGTMGFVLSLFCTVFLSFQFVSVKETQYPGASALLCATPYPRRLLVLSKYSFCVIVFTAACLLFWVETLLFPGLGTFEFRLAGFMFFAIAVFFGALLPVQFKLGYEKTKFVFAGVIIVSPFLLSRLLQVNSGTDWRAVAYGSPWLLCGLLAAAGLLFFAGSAALSIRFYNKADLA